ncbi:hypothetical protein GCM10010191_22360 [Actinomadura vinacea]|uniref:DUF5753 domain-containing protein n=1 Tax=Actinomadura vinacea TaxID=115336 RepID=A0ABN3IS81_9ACTN
MIAAARLLRVLDDSSVTIALPSLQYELAVTPAHLSTVNAGCRDDGELQVFRREYEVVPTFLRNRNY